MLARISGFLFIGVARVRFGGVFAGVAQVAFAAVYRDRWGDSASACFRG